ncbi:uncharacterized protein LOC113495617 [Trichoplusia ni]|uniref:Uncharacterized protein LOC113495617 n=1 Tax=Trichoplusia ni TaxID=7111 RepID=A0A7E5VPI8_TRINI|nr:uncharacterized protein LOC113495617 [Trichoplusia ni]
MWWLVVLWQFLLVAQGMHIMPERHYGTATEVSCIEYGAMNRDRIGRILREGWRSQSPVLRKMIKRSASVPVQFTLNMDPMSRRVDNIIDNIIPRSEHLLKEHAKLVQDINSLRQVVFITPFVEENKDYDDSIFHEIIETASSTTSRPSSLRPFVSSTRSPTSSTKGSSIPIILLGGASQRQVVKSQPINFAKPTVSLVGTTVSPLMKHPYPFVMHSPQRKPIKICMSSLPPMFPTTKRPPSFWDRLIDYFIPSRSLGR